LAEAEWRYPLPHGIFGQGCRAVPLAIVGHGSGAALLHRQPRLSAVESLELAFSTTVKTTALVGAST
jgi:hypothetical protein